MCPFAADPQQLDTGGIATSTPDGIGNACQCGDVNGNGVCNGQDANAVQKVALGQPIPNSGQHGPNADPSVPCPYCH